MLTCATAVRTFSLDLTDYELAPQRRVDAIQEFFIDRILDDPIAEFENVLSDIEGHPNTATCHIAFCVDGQDVSTYTNRF